MVIKAQLSYEADAWKVVAHNRTQELRELKSAYSDVFGAKKRVLTT
jgi:hypothetical protein